MIKLNHELGFLSMGYGFHKEIYIMKLNKLFLESDIRMRRLERQASKTGHQTDQDRLEQARARKGQSNFDMQFLEQWRNLPRDLRYSKERYGVRQKLDLKSILNLLPLPNNNFLKSLAKAAYHRKLAQHYDIKFPKNTDLIFKTWINAIGQGRRLNLPGGVYSHLPRKRDYWYDIHKVFRNLEEAAIAENKEQFIRHIMLPLNKNSGCGNILDRTTILKEIVNHFPYPPKGFGDLIAPKEKEKIDNSSEFDDLDYLL